MIPLKLSFSYYPTSATSRLLYVTSRPSQTPTVLNLTPTTLVQPDKYVLHIYIYFLHIYIYFKKHLCV